MKPLRDEVIVTKEEMLNKTESGIIIDDGLVEKQTKGKIIAIGKDVKEVSIDDNVLFGEHNYLEITINGEEVLFMSESSILAIL